MSIIKKYAEIFDPQYTFLSVGPKILPLNYLINIQKGGTLFFMFFLMCYYDNFSIGAWTYLALHGSYGFIWVIKDMVFPDKGFSHKISLPEVFGVSLVLVAYWGVGFIMMSGMADNNPTPERIFCCIFLYVVGLVLMVLTDLQKYLILQYRYIFFKLERV